MTTAVFVLSKNNVPNCQLDNAHATQTQVPGALSPRTCMERVGSRKYNSFFGLVDSGLTKVYTVN